jgi:hypothetical protein
MPLHPPPKGEFTMNIEAIQYKIATLGEDIYDIEISIFTLLDMKREFPSIFTMEVSNLIDKLESIRNVKRTQRNILLISS